MPNLAPFHQIFVFIHILGVFLFLIAHGVSVGVLFRLRSEREPYAIRTLLDLSHWSIGVMGVGLLIWLVTGILAGFSGNYWTTGRYWIWSSLLVAMVIVVIMTPWGRIYLNRVRETVGIDKKTGVIDATAIADPATVDAAILSGRPILLAAIGLGGVALLTWLMTFKPF